MKPIVDDAPRAAISTFTYNETVQYCSWKTIFIHIGIFCDGNIH